VAHGAAALLGTATAGAGTAEAVIDGEFFSPFDSLETVQEDSTANSAHRQIRIATMIDELGVAAAHGSVRERHARVCDFNFRPAGRYRPP
jgi:hypothetical protein